MYNVFASVHLNTYHVYRKFTVPYINSPWISLVFNSFKGRYILNYVYKSVYNCICPFWYSMMYSWWTATRCNTISGWWHITDDFIAWFNTVKMYITKRFKNLLYRLIHACTVLHIHVHVCVVKSKRKKQTIFWGLRMKCFTQSKYE